MIDYLQAFIPNSSGNMHERHMMAYKGAGVFPMQLLSFFQGFGVELPFVIEMSAYGESNPELKDLFNKYGSDKASSHNYDIFYNYILRKDMKNILEIGLGTNNEDVMSNMTSSGKPGASLRAFRDYLPEANIFGADIDSRILFEEERIQTFYVDQLNLDTLADLYNKLPSEFDLIIDDGLHSPEANLNVLRWALPLLKDGGWLVIEDIAEPAVHIWALISILLPGQQYESYIIKGEQGFLYAVRRST
jgi:SAM-dependent methyltransferase